jgi:probable phosphoglycerate mutase
MSIKQYHPRGYLSNITSFKNRIFIMRHGFAESNLAHLLVGGFEIGSKAFGLTDEGREAIKQQAASLKEHIGARGVQAKIITSDFLRAFQTAEIVKEILAVVTPLKISTLLRERDFGELNMQHITRAKEIEPHDLADPNSTYMRVEPLTKILERVTRQIYEIENDSESGHIFILISHGDPIRILMSALTNHPIQRFREIPTFKNGEWQEFNACGI